MSTKRPHGEDPTREQRLVGHVLLPRRLRIEHVNSKEGVCDLVMELCCALPNFRVRLTPWQPMV